jgi:hypothetical protein
MQTHRNKSNCFKSSELAGQPAGPFLPIYLNIFCSNLLLFLCRDVEVRLHVITTFGFVLQEASSLNTEVINLPNISVTRSCYVSLNNMWHNQGIACSPHNMWTESRCSKWQCIIWCGFFFAQECEFLVLLTQSQINSAHSWIKCQANFIPTVAGIHKLAGRLAWSLGKRRCTRWQWYE